MIKLVSNFRAIKYDKKKLYSQNDKNLVRLFKIVIYNPKISKIF